MGLMLPLLLIPNGFRVALPLISSGKFDLALILLLGQWLFFSFSFPFLHFLAALEGLLGDMRSGKSPCERH